MNVSSLASLAVDTAGSLATSLAGLFTSHTRLYRLEGEGGIGELLVESWSGREALNDVYEWRIHALSPSADVDLQSLLGQSATLVTVLADGSLLHRSGLVREAALMASDGGFARYRLRLVPWTWLLTQAQRQRTWQDKTVVQIVEAVFSLYAPHAQWRWADEVQSFLADTRPRSLCTQSRETDWAFVTRLLAEEGLGLRYEDTQEGAGVVIFADSAAVPEDATSAASQGGAGIRFHRASSQEQQDSIQAFGSQHRYANASTTLQSWDYKGKRSVAASVPTALVFSGKNAALLESYDTWGAYAHADSTEAQRYTTLLQQGIEARYEQQIGKSSVRSLRAGSRFTLTHGTDAQLGALLGQDKPAAEYVVLGVQQLGINNLPKEHNAAIAKSLGADPLLAELSASLGADLCRQAQDTGYANTFTALARTTLWRPEPALKPSASGPTSAIVVGPAGETEASGAGEIHTDALGRIRVRFHWQSDTEADTSLNTTWVRVAQPYAGAGIGSHFIPRVGQEVLVGFIGNDLDRPIVLGSLYNGQGESGVPITPGGKTGPADLEALKQSTDHRASAQGNKIGAGHSPAWHGAGAADQANTAALSGVKTQEFGGAGYNQLVFDDTDAQLRVQVKTTQHETQLNLGHLVHQADNHRGSFRGLGFELRTDAWGAVRAGGGVLISSYGTHESEPSGDNAAGLALAHQTQALAEAFSRAAGTHQTVKLGALVGIRPKDAAPLKAMHTALGAQVEAGDTQVPHTGEPIIAVAAKAGLAIAAGQDLQFSNGQALHLGSGQDTTLATGGALRVHTGQALAMLGGAVKAGSQAAGTGLTFIAAQGDFVMQAQADAMELAAKQALNVQSASTKVDIASPKKITMATTGGASIQLESGKLTVMCPGKITVKAATKSMAGGGTQSYSAPVMPTSVIAPVPERKLNSTFALDQLMLVARNFSKGEFVAVMVPIFGFEIPASVYVKLYDRLRAGSIENPPVVIMSGGHFPAAFDNKTRQILVHRAAADRAAKNRDESWELLTALLHEFGHYIDVVLREDLIDKAADTNAGIASDAEGDEGAKFAYQVALFDFSGSSEATYATYSSPEFAGSLRVNYQAARKAIQVAQGEEAQRIEGKQGSQEHFGAGRGEHHKDRPHESFGHQSIEDALAEANKDVFNASARLHIYFGNWLRDYSQVLDPKIVRNPSAPKDLTRYLSREALTKIIDILAEDEFVKEPADKATFAVTPSRLGVYRPVEHIDNPTNNDPNSVDPRSVDADFEPLPASEQLAVDPATSMKRYIRRSANYMSSELNKAVAAGRVAEGFRHFGAALHVLEDYFAHSNFVELSLRKVGYSKVLPWTSPAPGKHTHPVVTGMFDSDDVIASTAGLIADSVFKVKWEFEATKPGERNKADRLMLILLSEHSDPRLLKAFKEFLLWRDRWASVLGHQYAEAAMHYTLGMVGNAYNVVYGSLLHLLGNSVDDGQVLRAGDPNTNGSTNPTHSQLAKDHDNHPFHTLAAGLAKQAVKQVGVAMAARWNGDATADPAAIAAGYLVHPFDCSWQDQYVRAWAAQHPAQVKRGESSTEWEALHKAHAQEVRDAINKLGTRSKRTWDYLNDNFETVFGGKNQVKK